MVKKFFWHYCLLFLMLLGLLISVVLIYEDPIGKFPYSIYTSTNIFVWVFTSLNIIICFSIITYLIINNNADSLCLYYLLILIINRFILISIPSLKGILDYNGDSIYHQVIVNSIVTNGQYEFNPYPIIHILSSIIYYFTGLSVQTICLYIAQFFNMFSILGIYLLTKEITNKKIAIMSSVLSSIIFFTNIGDNDPLDFRLTPQGISLFYFPFCLFIVYKLIFGKNNFLFGPFMLISIMYTLFHPLSSIFLLISVIVILFIKNITKTSTKKSITVSNNSYYIISYVIFFFIINIYNIIINGSFIGFAKIFLSDFILLKSSVYINTIYESINYANLSISNLIILIFKLKISEVLIIILYFIGGFILMFKRTIIKTIKIKSLWFFILIPSSLYAGMLFEIIPGIESIRAVRFYQYFLLFSTIFVSFVYLYYLLKTQKKKLKYFLYFYLLIISLTSIPTLYNSPYKQNLLDPLLRVDVNGLSWFFNSRDKTVNIYQDYSFDSFRQFYIEMKKPELDIGVVKIYSIPSHFNYISNITLNYDYRDFYLFYNEYFKNQYLKLWANLNVFNQNDFNNLFNNYTLNKLYNNGSFNLYYRNNK